VKPSAVARFLVVGVGVIALATACGSSGSALSPVLPQSSQHAIAKENPLLAYVPTALPAGDHYSGRFSNVHDEVGLTFAGPTGSHRGFTFGAEQLSHSPCPALGTMHVFALNGVRVRWSGTFVDQQAWRCIERGGVTARIFAARSIAGDDSLGTPKARADALELARIVAGATYID